MTYDLIFIVLPIIWIMYKLSKISLSTTADIYLDERVEKHLNLKFTYDNKCLHNCYDIYDKQLLSKLKEVYNKKGIRLFMRVSASRNRVYELYARPDNLSGAIYMLLFLDNKKLRLDAIEYLEEQIKKLA